MAINKENLFIEKVVDGTMITGGHFMLVGDGTANLNPGTLDCFETAAQTYKLGKEKKVKVALGILINNMGAVCDSKKKMCVLNPEDLKNKFTLPEKYTEILRKYDIADDEVVIYWEKSLRNKGKKELHKKIEANAPYLELKEGAYWFLDPTDGRRITLSRPNPNDKYGIAACPLIMAAFAYQMQQDGYNSSLNFYYIDLDNEENIPNYFAIEKGRVVAETFYKKLNIMNVYLLKDKTITSFDLGKV